MEQYIKKDSVVAEIEKLISNGKFKCQQSQENNDQESYIAWSEHIATCGKILILLDTLEVKELPIWEKVSPDTGQTTLYKDGGKSYLERFGYRIDLEDLDKLPKKNLKAQKGE